MMLENAAKCEPVVTGLIRARDCGLSGQTLSHAGPPFAERGLIPKPVLHALAGSAVIEGWVKTFDDGISAILSGDIALLANHSIGIVSPMSGVVRPSQPLFVVRDAGGSARVTYAPLAEKGRRTLRFRCYDHDSVAGLARLENEIAPAVAGAFPSQRNAIVPLLDRSLPLGDDRHPPRCG